MDTYPVRVKLIEAIRECKKLGLMDKAEQLTTIAQDLLTLDTPDLYADYKWEHLTDPLESK